MKGWMTCHWCVGAEVAVNGCAWGRFKALSQTCRAVSALPNPGGRHPTHGGSTQPDPGAAVPSVLPSLLSRMAKGLSWPPAVCLSWGF